MVKDLKTGWKLLLAYLLTDEAYAVTITHYNLEPNSGLTGIGISSAPG